MDIVDAETRAEMRSAQLLSEALVIDPRRAHPAHVPVEATPDYEDAFGSGDLSDLTDLDSDEEDAAEEAPAEEVANGTNVDSDHEPDGDVGENPMQERPRRTCATNLDYAAPFTYPGLNDDYVPPVPQDSDSDYRPSASSHQAAPRSPTHRLHPSAAQASPRKSFAASASTSAQAAGIKVGPPSGARRLQRVPSSQELDPQISKPASVSKFKQRQPPSPGSNAATPSKASSVCTIERRRKFST